MSLKSRTERNIDFLDKKIEALEKETTNLKKLRFKMIGLLNSDDRYLKRTCEELGLKVTLVKLHKKYYKEKKNAKHKC